MGVDAFSAITGFFNESSSSDTDIIRVGTPDALEKFNRKLAQQYNLDELQDILDCEDNMLIIAGAGSGKTTSLMLKIIRDILSGKLLKWVEIDGRKYLHIKKILVSTFLKTGAEELSKKFDSLCKDFKIVGVHSSNISFKTIHSEVYAALKEMGVDINIIEPKAARDMLAESCKFYNVRSVMGRSKTLTMEDMGDIESIFAYVRNRLDGDKYNHPLMSEYGLDSTNVPAVLERFKLLKMGNKVQDFEDLEEMLYDSYKKFPNVFNYIKSRYDYVYVDEFQDTSQLQYAILEPYFRSADGFLTIGDDDQSIYSWRGSDPSLIQTNFEIDYKPVVKHLTVNRRCPKNILESVIPSIEKNTARHPKKLQALDKKGTLNIVIDGGVNYLSKSIKEDLSRSEKIGILGRTNADLLIPALVLLIDGYESFSISNSLSLEDRIPSQVIGVMQLITQRYNSNFEGYLKLFLTKYNAYQATKICDTLATTTDCTLYNMDLEDIRHSAPDLFPIIRMLRQEVKVDPVKAYLSLLEIIEQDVYNGKTIYAQRARDFAYYIRKIIKEHESLKGKTIEELYHLFYKELPTQLRAKKVLRVPIKDKNGKIIGHETPVDNAYVRITTVHDAKGKEWDNVYIWNDVEGCFPNSVGNRELTTEEFEEERRVHYIAWTRARKNLTVLTRSDRPKGFLGECLLTDETNTNIIEMSENRRRAKDVNSFNNKEVFRKKDEVEATVSPNIVVEKTWKDYLKEYILKYTSYNKICTPAGSHLDVCLTKLGGLEGLIEYLVEFKLENYPLNDLEGVISDILESKYNTY